GKAAYCAERPIRPSPPRHPGAFRRDTWEAKDVQPPAFRRRWQVSARPEDQVSAPGIIRPVIFLRFRSVEAANSTALRWIRRAAARALSSAWARPVSARRAPDGRPDAS